MIYLEMIQFPTRRWDQVVPDLHSTDPTLEMCPKSRSYNAFNCAT